MTLKLKEFFNIKTLQQQRLLIFVKVIYASFGSTCTKHGTKHFLQKALYILNRKTITIDHIFKFKLNQRTTV